MIILPVIPALADQSYRIPIENVEYVIRLQWSGRLLSWYMSLSDADEQPIHKRIRVVTGYRLLQTDVDPRRPPGDFYCFNFAPDYDGSSRIGLEQLGSEFKLYYLTAQEIDALKRAPDPLDAVTVGP